ncbi:MAG: cytochrome b [Tistlia sp.]|uniref:cytochrome b n=1 Tax=Tistlia sp. TaxID=3057121 RepID=UPI0034A332DC
MPEPEAPARYDATARALHWSVALLVLLQFPLAVYMDRFVEAFSQEQFRLYSLHKTIGVAILLLVVVRLGWRLVSPPPPLPASMPAWERRAAHTGHAALYLLLLAQPVVGLLHGFASGFPTVLLFGVTVPSLLATDKALTDLFGTAHFYLGWTFLAVVALHVAAALRHRFLLKDEILSRMLPGAR